MFVGTLLIPMQGSTTCNATSSSDQSTLQFTKTGASTEHSNNHLSLMMIWNDGVCALAGSTRHLLSKVVRQGPDSVMRIAAVGVIHTDTRFLPPPPHLLPARLS